MFSRRDLFGKLFGGALASTMKLDPTQALQGSVSFSEPLRMATMTLDTSAMTKVINDALRTVQYSLPNGSFLVIPPLIPDGEEDTMGVVASTG